MVYNLSNRARTNADPRGRAGAPLQILERPPRTRTFGRINRGYGDETRATRLVQLQTSWRRDTALARTRSGGFARERGAAPESGVRQGRRAGKSILLALCLDREKYYSVGFEDDGLPRADWELAAANFQLPVVNCTARLAHPEAAWNTLESSIPQTLSRTSSPGHAARRP